MNNEGNKIRINLTIDELMNPELFSYIKSIPKRKRAEKIRNDLEKNIIHKK